MRGEALSAAVPPFSLSSPVGGSAVGRTLRMELYRPDGSSDGDHDGVAEGGTCNCALI